MNRPAASSTDIGTPMFCSLAIPWNAAAGLFNNAASLVRYDESGISMIAGRPPFASLFTPSKRFDTRP